MYAFSNTNLFFRFNFYNIGHTGSSSESPLLQSSMFFFFLTYHGFLLTKLGSIRVLSAHFALRAATPSPEEIQRILDSDTLLVTVVVFGDRPDFAVDSYLLLVQGERTITPSQVRFDGRASRSAAWPGKPAYRAKVVATVPYADLDPSAVTRIAVLPGAGGEVSFRLDFSAIE